jgi:glycosyltransferase involved in cell wall biosynthesis
LYEKHWQGLYVDHPIPPVTGFDPLAHAAPAPSGEGAADRQLRLGFATHWDPVPQRTLSGSAWNLREALRRIADTADIGIDDQAAIRMALKLMHAHYRDGQFGSSWTNSRLTDAYLARTLRRGARLASAAGPLDAILMVNALTTFRQPFFIYYDSSWDALMASAENPARYARMRRLRPATMMRRRDFQVGVYKSATKVFASSHWLKRCLVTQSGLAPEQVHVVHPGGAARSLTGESGAEAETLRRRIEGPRRKILAVSRIYEISDFYRKGLDLVVDAVGVLRREYDPEITLTVAGLDKWPLPGGPPEGVDFLGVIPSSEVPGLYATHHVYVMPSRMEPFGLVFAEAQSRGMPVVARNAYAMPEMVTPGVSGALIDKDDPDELAAAIAGVLASDEIYEQCAARAPRMSRYFSWERMAGEVNTLVRATL